MEPDPCPSQSPSSNHPEEEREPNWIFALLGLELALSLEYDTRLYCRLDTNCELDTDKQSFLACLELGLDHVAIGTFH